MPKEVEVSKQGDNVNIKPYGTVYAILKTPEHIMNKEKIEAAEYFRFRLHGANVRARELGDEYAVKNIKVIIGQREIKSIEAIIPESDIGMYAKMSFIESYDDSIVELTKTLNKFPDAIMLMINVVTNMTKDELR